MTRKKSIDPERILDAAERILSARGAHSLTLDMVAAEAGISKGGLTYSFPTKEALLSAMLDRGIARLRARLKPQRGSERALPCPELRRWLGICRGNSKVNEVKIGAILAALQHAPGSLKSTRSYIRWMLSKFAPDTELGRRARLVFYATQGLFLLQGFGLLTLTAAKRKRIMDDFVSFLAVRSPR
jgi:AcrR family transcriptional regulator